MQLIEMAQGALLRQKLIILDEPTATLTSKEVERLFEILKKPENRKGVTISISRIAFRIYEIGDTVTVLRDARWWKTRRSPAWRSPDIVRLMLAAAFMKRMAYAKTRRRR